MCYRAIARAAAARIALKKKNRLEGGLFR